MTALLEPRHSRRLAARLWWALLPYAGETGYADDEYPARWFAYPLTWLWQVARKLPGSAPFELVMATSEGDAAAHGFAMWAHKQFVKNGTYLLAAHYHESDLSVVAVRGAAREKIRAALAEIPEMGSRR